MNWRVLYLGGMLAAGCAPAPAHLCDNVFRQADKLIVKPEFYNLVVKDRTTCKVFLQNNMDRGIAEISLLAESPAFDFSVTPPKMSLPVNQRAYFEVTLSPKAATTTGNYPINFRLVGGGRLFKRFNINTFGQAEAPPPKVDPEAPLRAKSPAPAAHNQGGVSVPSVAPAPVIDGEVRDDAWRAAAVLANFSSRNGGQAVYDTTGLMLYDRTNLYVSLYCNDEPAGLWTDDDRVEIRLTLNAAGFPHYVFAVTPRGRVFLKTSLAANQDTVWTASGIRFVVRPGERDWTMEAAIPASALNVPGLTAGQTWQVRIVRVKASGNAETSYWAPEAGGYNQEQGFGQIRLSP